MTPAYAVPAYAVTTWVDADHYVVQLSAGHTVRIPLNKPDQLVAVLKARHRAELRRIGTEGAPTQATIDRDRTHEVVQIEQFSVAQKAATLRDLCI